jgi:hypothetical protein
MHHIFSIGNSEKHLIDMSYDQFWGRFEIKVDNITAISRLFMFDFAFTRDFDLWVGVNEKHHLRINKTRPTFFAGFRPHTYMIYIDGVMVNRFEA